MATKRGLISFSTQIRDTNEWFNFTVNEYVTISELNSQELQDFSNNKYVKDLTIKCVSTAIFNIGIHYTDGTSSSTTTGVGNVQTELRTHFGLSPILIICAVTNGSSISFNVVDTINEIFLYTMNSSNNTVSKSITFVKHQTVKYTRPINYKNLQLDIKESISHEKYNYAYLTGLNRFYFITDKTLTNDYALLDLREDVLMSFSDLIRSQTAFVERNENNYDNYLMDNLVSFDYEKSITTQTITPLVTLFPTTDVIESTRDCYVITVVSSF